MCLYKSCLNDSLKPSLIIDWNVLKYVHYPAHKATAEAVDNMDASPAAAELSSEWGPSPCVKMWLVWGATHLNNLPYNPLMQKLMNGLLLLQSCCKKSNFSRLLEQYCYNISMCCLDCLSDRAAVFVIVKLVTHVGILTLYLLLLVRGETLMALGGGT